MYDLFIKEACIISQNKEHQIFKANIGIKKGIISYIGPNNYQAKEVIKAKDKYVLPGLINAHIHFGEYFIRGYDGKLTTEGYISYAENYNKKWKLKAEQIRLFSTKTVVYESIKNGTTTLMGLRGWGCAENYGLRLFLGYPLMKSDKLNSYLNTFSENIIQLRKEMGNNIFIGLHSIQWVDEKLLESISKCYEKSNYKLSIHVCETKKEVKLIKSRYGKTPIEVLEKYNLLTENTLLVHCNYLSDVDINIIKKFNSSVVTCPNSNLKLGNAIPGVEKLIKAGINVMVGTDGSATNDSLNLLDSCKTLALMTKISAKDIFDMITVNCAKYFKNNSGSIELGNKADLIMYDKKEPEFISDDKFISNLIFSSNVLPTDVIASGKILLKSGKNLLISKEKLYEEKQKLF